VSGAEHTEAAGPELAWGPKADGSAVANAAAAFNADMQAIARAEALVTTQRAAFRADPSPSLAARHADLERLARALLAQRETVAATISDDFGNRARQESLLAEVFVTVKAIRHAQAHLAQWMAPRPQPVDWLFQPGRAELRPQPLGVIGIISPWNYPVQLALAPLVAALAAGNRCLLKPSELTPRTSALLQTLLGEIFSEDKVAVVTGGPALGEAFAGLPFDHLIFTGSTAVGRRVMAAAAARLTPVTLELGGKSPALVGPDAPIADTAARVMTGKLFNAGQTCIAPDYALVPAGQRDAFVSACRDAAAKMYPTLARNPDYTSIVHPRHVARLHALLDDARARGAVVIELNPGAERLDPASQKVCPHLVLDAPDDAQIMQEEIFGPILPVRTYTDLGEALAFVNDRPRPLALYYFGRDRGDIDRVLRETVSGGVTVNETLLHVAVESLPFGGVGASGMGQYHGQAGFDALSRIKPVFHQLQPNATALLRPPFGRVLDALLRVLLR
jgi:coniferyl-aldehyde dehydrogenase